MADAIKAFFRKKKTDSNFKKAGPAKRLTDNTNQSTGKTVSASSSSSSSSSVKRPSPSSESAIAAQKARDAAIKRIEEKSQPKQRKPETLENILQSERRTISEAYKVRDDNERLAKEQSKCDDRYREFESKQLFRCPLIGIDESFPIDTLIANIKEYIRVNFNDDLTLMNVMLMKNSHCGIVNDQKQQQLEQCISTIDKILSNLLNANAEEREKFKKLRKSKVEQRIVNIDGSFEFLYSIGFETDPSNEWLIYHCDDDTDISEQMNYYRDVLKDAPQFPIILDRQSFVFTPDSNKRDENLESDFFKLSVSEVSREQQQLTAKREIEETLRTKAMREQNVHSKSNCKFTRLRLKFPSGVLMEANFAANETLADVKTWLMEQSESLNNVQLFFGRDMFTPEQFMNTLSHLNLVPAAALIIRLEGSDS